MHHENCFKDFFESIPGYGKITLVMFLIENDVEFFFECGSSKTEVENFQNEFEKILIEENKDYLDCIKEKKNQHSFVEQILEDESVLHPLGFIKPNKKRNILLQLFLKTLDVNVVY